MRSMEYDGSVDIEDAFEMPKEQVLAFLGFAALRAAQRPDYQVSVINGMTDCGCGSDDCEEKRPSLLFSYHRDGADIEEVVSCSFCGLEIVFLEPEECDDPLLQMALKMVHSAHDEPNDGLGDGLMALKCRGIPKGIELLKAHSIRGEA